MEIDENDKKYIKMIGPKRVNSNGNNRILSNRSSTPKNNRSRRAIELEEEQQNGRTSERPSMKIGTTRPNESQGESDNLYSALMSGGSTLPTGIETSGKTNRSSEVSKISPPQLNEVKAISNA